MSNNSNILTVRADCYWFTQTITRRFSCLPAAFDTITHSVLLIRLSYWFGTYGSAIQESPADAKVSARQQCVYEGL